MHVTTGSDTSSGQLLLILNQKQSPIHVSVRKFKRHVAGSAKRNAESLQQQAQLSPQGHMSAKAERKSCYGLSRRASLVVAPVPSLAAADEMRGR